MLDRESDQYIHTCFVLRLETNPTSGHELQIKDSAWRENVQKLKVKNVPKVETH